MRLYSGTTRGLIDDSAHNRLTTKLGDAFFHYFRYKPPESEVKSWRESLRAVSQVFETGKLLDHGVLLELQLPHSSMRLDCMVTGQDENSHANAVILELKQWEKTEESPGENEVVSFVGGRLRDVLHPSRQVERYQTYLEDNHTSFDPDNGIRLHGCAYLHNYDYAPNDPLLAPKFRDLLTTHPTFSSDEVDALVDFMKPPLIRGGGEEILGRVDSGAYRASKKLLDHVASVIHGKREYVLLDEQLVVFDRVLFSAERAANDKRKTVILIKGGPGTGKSVIAMNLVGALSARGYNAHYVTGSKAFTETLRKIIGSRGAAQFKYFNSYMQAEYNSIDVLVCDEAHRMRTNSNSRFTTSANRTNRPQIEELLDAGKTSVFFIDDDQVVRPGEIGSSAYIKEQASSKNCNVLEYELEAQFRCEGADGFINWVNNTLGIKRTANVLWNVAEEFEFKIVESPQQLESAIRQKIAGGYTGRVSAGFCWPWTDPKSDGSLVSDVQIGDYSRPWNAKPDSGRLAAGIPKSNIWAYDPQGINQVGCIYTAQGFEFDYIGVIFGTDLVYNHAKSAWEGNSSASFDTVVKKSKGDFVKLVKNTYRVLLTRGMKGCYVCFLDKPTETFFRSRLENVAMEPNRL